VQISRGQKKAKSQQIKIGENLLGFYSDIYLVSRRITYFSGLLADGYADQSRIKTGPFSVHVVLVHTTSPKLGYSHVEPG
jgi:hypothetical protein